MLQGKMQCLCASSSLMQAKIKSAKRVRCSVLLLLSQNKKMHALLKEEEEEVQSGGPVFRPPPSCVQCGMWQASLHEGRKDVKSGSEAVSACSVFISQKESVCLSRLFSACLQNAHYQKEMRRL